MADPRIALVTGTNKGLGFETSRQLAKMGIKVLMSARDENKGMAAVKIQKFLLTRDSTLSLSYLM
jgi:(+)-neomenthol dehydrogenase